MIDYPDQPGFAFPCSLIFPLEKGVPVTGDASGERKCSVDREMLDRTFAKMEIGDCFSVHPQEGEHVIYVQNAVSGAASSWAKKRAELYSGVPKPVFTTRQQKGGFVRCWRVL